MSERTAPIMRSGPTGRPKGKAVCRSCGAKALNAKVAISLQDRKSRQLRASRSATLCEHCASRLYERIALLMLDEVAP